MGASLALRLQAQAYTISKEVAMVARWQGTPAYGLKSSATTILPRRQRWGWGGGGGVVAGASAAAQAPRQPQRAHRACTRLNLPTPWAVAGGGCICHSAAGEGELPPRSGIYELSNNRADHSGVTQQYRPQTAGAP